MEDKKIDRIFQEKLKDLEITPNLEIWENIEKELTKKKKRKTIPFWWFLSGASASIVLFFILFSTNNDNNNHIKENIIVSPKKIDNIVEENKIKFIEETFITEKNNNKKINNTVIVESKVIEKERKKEVVKRREKVNTGEEFLKGYSFNQKIAMKKFNEKKEVVKREEKVNTVEEFLKDNSSSQKIATKKFNKEFKNKTKESKKVAFKAIVEKSKIKKENIDKKWGISPVVGIIVSNSLSKASSLNKKLNNNTLSSDGTIAYGLKISYNISDKWSVQSGVQVQKNIFNTENVGLVSATASFNEESNIDFKDNRSLNFISLETISGTNSQSDTPATNPEIINGEAIDVGVLQQTYNYIEIPIEAKYLIHTSKNLKMKIVSGFSTLFLTKNVVTAKTSTFNTELGEANNLNNLNFSGNVGLDFTIQLSKNINININPMFKAHMNMFSKESNGFKPYNVGVYSGLRYEF